MSINRLDQNSIISISQDEDLLNFFRASQNCDIGFMRDFIIRRTNDVNRVDDYHHASATHFAARGNNLEGLRLLLDNGATLGSANVHGYSEIHHAIDKTQEMVSLLLRHTPELANQNDGMGLTPLMLASCYGNYDIVETLIASGADINAQCRENQATTLMIATEEGKFEIADLLLDKENINLSLTTIHGNNALHYACDASEELATLLANKILAKNPTLLNSTNNNNQTALDIAIAGHNIATASFLLDQEGIRISEKTVNLLSRQRDEAFHEVKGKALHIMNSLPGTTVTNNSSARASEIVRALESEDGSKESFKESHYH